ncbi:2172_t:CDS:1, partial [Ambispora leptoticha]
SLTKILHMASSFYKFASIKVNPHKSILTTNSTTPDKSILFDNEQLTAIKNGTPFKYLGAWFSTSGKPISVQKEIIAEAIINLKKLQFAHITEKQAIYIINSVITPRLLYRLYSSFLSTSQLSTLNKTCIQLVKNKAKLARGVPNSFIFNPDIYALNNLAQAQLSSLVLTFQKNLNHVGFDSSFLKL